MSAIIRSASEEPFFFGQGQDRLFGFLHRAHTTPRAAIVMCHALGEEKLWSHRVYVTFAREMAARGYQVLRFDMRGEGDSSLEFEESTIESRVADTLRAVEVARERTGSDVPLILLGHRFGAAVAALAATKLALLGGLVLWDPVVDGEEYLGALLRSNLATQMATQGKVTRTRESLMTAILGGETVVVDGYGLSPALCRELLRVKWANTSELLSHPSLILEVPKGAQTTPSAAFVGLTANRPGLQLGLAAEPPFWRETRQFHKRAPHFTEATTNWLQTIL